MIKEIKFFAPVAIAIGTLTGCASTENQIKEAVRKNPDLVFDVIRENPSRFIQVVNEAAMKARAEHEENRAQKIAREMEEDLKNPKEPALDPSRRLSGNDDGKIILVEYADFQCPACRMGQTALRKFKEKYRDQVQFYYKNMPLDFHEMALPAALYFEALLLQDKDKARRFHAEVYENQARLKDESFLKETARKVGSDMKRLEKDVKSKKVVSLVKADMEEFQKFGFTGTPVILVNGVALHGAPSFENLERVLEMTRK